MIPIIERPPNADTFDGQIVFLDNYSKEERIEYWKKKCSSVKFMHDYYPKAYRNFVRNYGEDVASEILAMAD